MRSKRLVVPNAVLVAVSALCVAYIVQAVVAPIELPALRHPPSGFAMQNPSAPPARSPTPGYAAIATRNLFSPTRSEGPPAPPGPPAPAPVIKLYLHGVVVTEQGSVAYLEDPATKRVMGYRVGDAIAGGRVETISPDRVVLARAEGAVEIRLRDPARPKAPAITVGVTPSLSADSVSPRPTPRPLVVGSPPAPKPAPALADVPPAAALPPPGARSNLSRF